MIRTLPFVALVSLLFLALTAVGDWQRVSVTNAGTVTIVRVLSMDGVGPDRRIYRLFNDTDGFVTTLDALGRVAYQVSGTTLPEGAYHTLFVQLADEYQQIQTDGTELHKYFSVENTPSKRRLRGMIMVRNGKATPLRVLKAPSYSSAILKAPEHHDSHDE